MPSDSITFDLVLTRVFEAPVELVWQAWTEGEQVKRWWGPKGFTAPIAEMDVRVAGRSLLAMRAPAEYGGQVYYNTWTYSVVEPQRRLEFVLNFSDATGQAQAPADLGLPAGIPRDVPHVLTFEALDPGRTRLTVKELGYTTAQARDISRAGLEQCLDKMAAGFAALAGARS